MDERSRPRIPKYIRLVLPALLAALYIPLIAMVVGSFLESAGVLTLRWYHEVFADPILWESLARSCLVATFAGLISTVLGLIGAIALDKWVFGGQWPLRALSLVSLMLPELVLSLALLSWYALIGLPLSLTTVIIAHVTLTLPFVILVIGSRLRGLDSSFEDAARDLGATETQVLFKVTLPLLAPAVLTAFLLAFLISFDDFLVTYYTNGAGSDTLPVRLYSLMKTGLTPKVQALSSLMLIASVTLIYILVKLRGLDGGLEPATAVKETAAPAAR